MTDSLTNPPPPSGPEPTDYLWDRSGPADTLVAELESKLSPLAYKSDRLTLEARPLVRGPLFSWRWGSLIAATLALAAIAGWFARGVRVHSGWAVEDVQGAPAIGSSRIADGTPLRTGEWLVTDAASSATLRADIGHVTVRPNSRLQMVRDGRSGSGVIEHRLSLARGSMRPS